MTFDPSKWQLVPKEPTVEILRFYGYAPGGYASRCIRGGHIVEGLDKRATCCRPCAEGAYRQFLVNFASAPQAPVVEGIPRKRYFIGHDSSGHRYLVPADHRNAWSEWCALPEDDELGWEVPEAFEAIRIDGAFVTFTNPTVYS